MTTRRGFMQLLAGAMLAPVSAKVAYAAPSAPVVVGDDFTDIHADTFQHVQGPWRKDGPFK